MSTTNSPFVYLPPSSPSTPGTHSTTSNSPHDVTVSCAGGVLPVVYGQRQINGNVVYLNVIANQLHIIYLLCEGEIESVDLIKVNNTTPPIGSYIEYFKGTSSQTVCSLHSYDATWTDALTGIAYLYCRFSQSQDLQDLPAIQATIKGKKLYDPRTSSTLYSNNPALVIGDLLTGAGRINTSKIDWISVSTAADWCDSTITDSGNSETRYTFDYYFNSGITIQAAIELVRIHFLGAVLFDEGIYRIELAKPRNTIASFQDKEVWGVAIPSLQSQDKLNKVNYQYLDYTTWENIDDYLIDPTLGTYDEIHEKSYDLTGCGISQAKRIATFLINSRLSDLTINFNTYNGKGLQIGDVFNFTHQLGFSEKLFYVSSIAQAQDGSFTIVGKEYDPLFYADVIETVPTYADTDLPKPTDTPTEIGGLVLAEKLEQLKDSTWISNIEIQWDASDFIFTDHYEVWIKQDSGSYKLQGITTGTDYTVRACKELSTYTVKIITVSTWKKKSTGVELPLVVMGKYLKPTWKVGATLTGQEAGDIVFLQWFMPDNSAPAEDIDLKSFELKRGRSSDTWDTAAFVDRISALAYQDRNCPSGDWIYFLKAVDSVGGYSDTAITCSVTVTLNPFLGFQNTYNFAVSGTTGSNITTDGESIVPVSASYDTWTEAYPSTWDASSYSNFCLPAPSTADGTTTAIDLGAVVGGKWTLYFQATKIGTGTASVTPYLELSNDGSSWTEYAASSSFSAKARYAKAKFAFASSALDTTYYVYSPIYIVLKADPLEDYGEVSVSGSGSYSITFSKTFLSVEKITLTPSGSAARIAVYDNETLSGFTLRLFDAVGSAVSGTVKWRVEGY